MRVVVDRAIRRLIPVVELQGVPIVPDSTHPRSDGGASSSSLGILFAASPGSPRISRRTASSIGGTQNKIEK